MNTLSLPEGYTLLREIDLQKNKKLAVLINLAALIACVPLVRLGLAIQPLTRVGDTVSFTIRFLPILVLVVGTVAYVFLHELVHGICIWYYCGEKAEYGFTGLFAYAGKKNAYFDKKSYVTIALAPVVIWGIVLLALNLLCGAGWFWVIYALQIFNLSGAAGDLYVTYLIIKMPKETLVNDSGVSMRFYVRRKR